MIVTRSDARELIQNNEGQAMKKAYKLVESACINEALILSHGNQTKAAQMLGMCRSTFKVRLKEIRGVKA